MALRKTIFAGAFVLAASLLAALSVGANFAAAAQDVDDAPITFRFEDYEPREAPYEADKAAVTAALYEFFPIGSEVERIRKWIEAIGGKCYYYPDFDANLWICKYEHVSLHASSQFPYRSALWRPFVYFSGEPQIIEKIEIRLFGHSI